MSFDPRVIVDRDELERLVLAACRQTDRDWQVSHRLPGGYQQGAFLLVDGEGAETVLKPTLHPMTPARVDEIAHMINSARAQGWPTPRWLASGCVNGRGWWLTEFATGEAPETVTAAFAEAVRPVIDRQAGLRPVTAQNWSTSTKRVVFSDEFSYLSSVAAFSPAGASLAGRIRALTEVHRSVPLPDDDFVHGNLDPGNVILRDGAVIAIIDVEAVGKGTRAVDVGGLAINAAIWGDPVAAAGLSRLCASVAGPAVARICLSAAAAAVVASGVRHWPRHVDPVSIACERFLSRLGW